MTHYNSAVSTWLVIILVISLGLPLAGTLYQQDWITSSILLATIAFIAHLFVNTYYVIEGNTLKVKAGFLYNVSIAIQDIKKIEKSNSLLSSPALSFDRIEIFYGKFDSVLVSPKDKRAVIDDLLKLNPTINMQNA